MASRSAGSKVTRAGSGADEKSRSRDGEVIQTAVDLFYRRGYAASSVQDVADALGMLKGSLYYYIHSKDDLLRRIFDENHLALTDIVERARAMDATPLGRLTAFLLDYGEWFLVNLERASLYQREWRYVEGEFGAVVAQRRADLDAFVVNLITDASDDGYIHPSASARRATYFIFNAFNGLSDWYQPGGPETPRKIAESYTAMALCSLGVTEPGKIIADPSEPPAARRGRRPAKAAPRNAMTAVDK